MFVDFDITVITIKSSLRVEDRKESFYLCLLCSATGGGLLSSVQSSLVFSDGVGFPALPYVLGTQVLESVLLGNPVLTCIRLKSHWLGGSSEEDNVCLLGEEMRDPS